MVLIVGDIFTSRLLSFFREDFSIQVHYSLAFILFHRIFNRNSPRITQIYMLFLAFYLGIFSCVQINLLIYFVCLAECTHS